MGNNIVDMGNDMDNTSPRYHHIIALCDTDVLCSNTACPWLADVEPRQGLNPNLQHYALLWIGKKTDTSYNSRGRCFSFASGFPLCDSTPVIVILQQWNFCTENISCSLCRDHIDKLIICLDLTQWFKESLLIVLF